VNDVFISDHSVYFAIRINVSLGVQRYNLVKQLKKKTTININKQQIKLKHITVTAYIVEDSAQ